MPLAGSGLKQTRRNRWTSPWRLRFLLSSEATESALSANWFQVAKLTTKALEFLGPTPQKRLENAAFLVAAAWIVVSSISITIEKYIPLPYVDSWGFVNLSAYSLAFLLIPHGVHRILFPALVFYLDLVLDRGRNTLTLVVSYVSIASYAFLLLRKLSPATVGTRYYIASCATIVALLFSAMQYTNITWSFGLTFLFMCLFSMLSLNYAAAFVFASPNFRTMNLVGAIAAGFVASLSLATGILVFVPVAVLVHRSRPPLRELVALYVSIVAIGGGLLLGKSANAYNLASFSLIKSLVFAFAFIGSPIGTLCNDAFARLYPEDWIVSISALAGAAISALSVWFIVGVLRSRTPSFTELLTSGYASFGLLTGLVVGFGRSDLALSEATSSRYTTPALLLIAALIAVILTRLRTLGREVPRRFIPVLAVLIGLLVLEQNSKFTWARIDKVEYGFAETALITNAYDEAALTKLYPTPAIIEPIADMLRARGLSLFAEPDAKFDLLDKSVAGLVLQDECAGAFDGTKPVGSGERSGYSASCWLQWGAVDDPETVIVDAKSMVVGFGVTGFDRPDVAARYPQYGGHPGWQGEIARRATGTLTAYAVGGNVKCRIGSVNVRPN
jgi:hypothetical protein